MQVSALNFIYFLAAIGAIYFMLFLIKILWGLLTLIIPSKNLRECYGENCWAVITGASDGIGLGFCEELAAVGINICLVARNLTKCQNVQAELKKINPKIQTRIIVVDFVDCQREGFFERIIQQLKDIDIGILINNVGVCNIGYLHEISSQRLINEINVNCVPMTILTSLIVPKLLNREPRSAIINISSSAGLYPCPYLSTYSSTKAYNDFFSKAISMEYEDKIDVQSVQPMMVETKLMRGPRGSLMATRNQCAAASLKSLGMEYETSGWWRHRFINYIIRGLPKFLVRFVSERESKKIMLAQKHAE